MSFALEGVRSQYERYPFPAYGEANVGLARKWLKDLGLAKFQRVLDVGCGTGLYSNAFALEGADVTGIDFTNASLTIAKRMAGLLGTSIRFVQSDLFRFEENSKYDLVFCGGVLHHTANARAGFAHIRTFVRRGGSLAVGLYNRGLSPVRISKWVIRHVAGDDLESRRRLAEALFSTGLPHLAYVVAGAAGAAFSGAEVIGQSAHSTKLSSFSVTYRERVANLIDLVCHEFTSYHTPREVEGWFNDEGLLVEREVPDRETRRGELKQLLSNYIFYVGRDRS